MDRNFETILLEGQVSDQKIEKKLCPQPVPFLLNPNVLNFLTDFTGGVRFHIESPLCGLYIGTFWVNK